MDKGIFSRFRLFLITAYIRLNEIVLFYPRLKKVFKNKLGYPPSVVLDIGANKGQTISFFKNLNKNVKIFSFEPTPSLFRYLENKYKSFSDIKIYELAASSYNGERVFFENYFDETSSFSKLNYESEYLKFKSNVLGVKPKEIIVKDYNVQVVKLCDFINDYIDFDIDVLKIDVEGHEYDCLKGLFSNSLNVEIHLIQLEFHEDDMYEDKITFKQIDDLLNENNYKLVESVNHGFGEFKDFIYQKK